MPPLAALALSGAIQGARRTLALLVVPLFLLACGPVGRLPADASALALSALACVALGSLLAGCVPVRWIKIGIYAMAIVDALLVGADLLQGPDNVLNAASPAGGLPQLQFAQFGSALIGFGDLFIAAVLGAMLAGDRSLHLRTAGIAALLVLAFDLLFFLVTELPATVPIALALAVTEISKSRAAQTSERARRVPESGPGGTRDARRAARPVVSGMRSSRRGSESSRAPNGHPRLADPRDRPCVPVRRAYLRACKQSSVVASLRGARRISSCLDESGEPELPGRAHQTRWGRRLLQRQPDS